METIKKMIQNIAELKQYLKGLVNEMEYSHSSLTKKRLELWLFNKIHLGKGKVSQGYLTNGFMTFAKSCIRAVMLVY
jgi:hypothetical protein